MITKTEQSLAINPNPVLSVTTDGTVLFSNAAGEPLLHEWDVEIGEKLPSSIRDLVKRVSSRNVPERMEIEAGKKTFLVDFRSFPDEEHVGIYGFEISDRKEFEAKLLENEEKYRAIFENSIDAVLFTSPDGTILAANPAACKMFRMSEGEIIQVGRNGIQDLSDPRLKPALDKRARTGRFKGELNYRRKEGTIFPGEVSSAVFKDKNGVARTAVIIRDLTERKQFEETLKESEAKSRQLIKHAPTGIYEVDFNSMKYTNVNDAMCQILGYTREELLTMNALDLLDEKSKVRFGERVKKSLAGEELSSQVEYLVIGKDGRKIWVLLNVQFKYEGEKAVGALVVAHDITERKHAEEAILESEQHYRLLFETMLQGVVYQDADGKIISMNPAAERILGKTAAEFLGSSSVSEEYHTIREDGSPFPGFEHPAMVSLRTGRKVQNAVMGIYNPREKRHRWININAVPLFWTGENKPFQVYTLFEDITERKRAEEALRESKARVESIFRSSPVGIGVVVDRLIKEANERLCEITGYSREELMGKSALMLYPTEGEYERVGMVKYGMIAENGKGYVETCWRRKDGSVVDILLSSSPIIPGDLSGEITFTALDITERKQAEEALKKAHDTLEEKVKERTLELEKAYNSLKESEKSLAEAQEIAHIGNWDLNLTNGEVYWSDELYRIFRRNSQESGATFDEFLSYVHPHDRDKVDNAVKNAKNGEIIAGDYRIILHNGNERIVNTYAELIFDEKNIPVRMKGIVQDITERKEAEEKLRESEEKYRNIVEIANEGILVIDDKLTITYYNKKLSEMLGYNSEEGIGRPIWDYIREESKVDVKYNMEKRLQDINEPYEIELICKDGSSIWVLLNSKSLFDKNGKFLGSISMLTDITAKKETEDALEKIEIARKQEIHHRIKNNLQVISSLLDLQAEQFRNKVCIRDSEVMEAFRESQDRVISMALIHEELYKGGGFETLKFSSYIKELAENLLQTYSVGKINICLNMDLEENIFFDMDIAVPLGMIINELVTNSLKHAFPDRKKGEIQIKLSREESGECIKYLNKKCKNNFILIVSDNGIGVPEDLIFEDLDSLGMQLVSSLVDQLDGELELRRGNGTNFIIRFKVTEKDNRESTIAPQLVDND